MASLTHFVELDGDWATLAAPDTYDSFGYQIEGHGTAALAIATTAPAADSTAYIVLAPNKVESFSLDLLAGYGVYARQLGQKPARLRGFRVPSA